MGRLVVALGLLLFLATFLLGPSGCGKKGPPQPPDERFYTLDARKVSSMVFR